MHAFQTAASAFCIACICAEITTLLVGAGWAGRCIKAVAGLYILVILFRLAPQMKLELKSAAAAAPAAVVQATAVPVVKVNLEEAVLAAVVPVAEVNLVEAAPAAENLPVVKVQHHYAHILSCMAENDCAEQVIGVSFDGTGYGTDGTIWGGEILLSDLDGFTRVGSVMPFLQVGGDASSKEGWRIAVSLIYGMTGDRKKAAEITEKLELCTKQEANVQFTMADRKINAVISTSAGRLFDGMSAMLGIRRKSTFEGEASMALEFAAEEYRETMLEKSKQQIQETEKYGYDKEDTDTLSRNENLSETEEIKRMDDKLISAGDRLLLNTESLIKEILNRQLNGEDPGKLAYFFHRELACQITAACVKIRELSGCNKAALSGGVFQNRLLLELTDHMLLEQGFEVLKHQLLPPNDGGIALGQAVYAMAYLEKSIETKTI